MRGRTDEREKGWGSTDTNGTSYPDKKRTVPMPSPSQPVPSIYNPFCIPSLCYATETRRSVRDGPTTGLFPVPFWFGLSRARNWVLPRNGNGRGRTGRPTSHQSKARSLIRVCRENVAILQDILGFLQLPPRDFRPRSTTLTDSERDEERTRRLCFG